jgi:hypothetical protein
LSARSLENLIDRESLGRRRARQGDLDPVDTPRRWQRDVQ